MADSRKRIEELGTIASARRAAKSHVETIRSVLLDAKHILEFTPAELSQFQNQTDDPTKVESGKILLKKILEKIAPTFNNVKAPSDERSKAIKIRDRICDAFPDLAEAIFTAEQKKRFAVIKKYVKHDNGIVEIEGRLLKQFSDANPYNKLVRGKLRLEEVFEKAKEIVAHQNNATQIHNAREACREIADAFPDEPEFVLPSEQKKESSAIKVTVLPPHAQTTEDMQQEFILSILKNQNEFFKSAIRHAISSSQIDACLHARNKREQIRQGEYVLAVVAHYCEEILRNKKKYAPDLIGAAIVMRDDIYAVFPGLIPTEIKEENQYRTILELITFADEKTIPSTLAKKVNDFFSGGNKPPYAIETWVDVALSKETLNIKNVADLKNKLILGKEIAMGILHEINSILKERSVIELEVTRDPKILKAKKTREKIYAAFPDLKEAAHIDPEDQAMLEKIFWIKEIDHVSKTTPEDAKGTHLFGLLFQPMRRFTDQVLPYLSVETLKTIAISANSFNDPSVATDFHALLSIILKITQELSPEQLSDDFKRTQIDSLKTDQKTAAASVKTAKLKTAAESDYSKLLGDIYAIAFSELRFYAAHSRRVEHSLLLLDKKREKNPAPTLYKRLVGLFDFIYNQFLTTDSDDLKGKLENCIIRMRSRCPELVIRQMEITLRDVVDRLNRVSFALNEKKLSKENPFIKEIENMKAIIEKELHTPDHATKKQALENLLLFVIKNTKQQNGTQTLFSKPDAFKWLIDRILHEALIPEVRSIKALENAAAKASIPSVTAIAPPRA